MFFRYLIFGLQETNSKTNWVHLLIYRFQKSTKHRIFIDEKNLIFPKKFYLLQPGITIGNIRNFSVQLIESYIFGGKLAVDCSFD